MRTLMIGYDLNRAGQNYDGIIAEIKNLGTWWHYLDSTWLVETNETHVTARNRLAQYLDRNDELLVIDVSRDEAAWQGFVPAAGQWIKEHL